MSDISHYFNLSYKNLDEKIRGFLRKRKSDNRSVDPAYLIVIRVELSEYTTYFSTIPNFVKMLGDKFDPYTFVLLDFMRTKNIPFNDTNTNLIEMNHIIDIAYKMESGNYYYYPILCFDDAVMVKLRFENADVYDCNDEKMLDKLMDKHLSMLKSQALEKLRR